MHCSGPVHLLTPLLTHTFGTARVKAEFVRTPKPTIEIRLCCSTDFEPYYVLLTGERMGNGNVKP